MYAILISPWNLNELPDFQNTKEFHIACCAFSHWWNYYHNRNKNIKIWQKAKLGIHQRKNYVSFSRTLSSNQHSYPLKTLVIRSLNLSDSLDQKVVNKISKHGWKLQTRATCCSSKTKKFNLGLIGSSDMIRQVTFYINLKKIFWLYHFILWKRFFFGR